MRVDDAAAVVEVLAGPGGHGVIDALVDERGTADCLYVAAVLRLQPASVPCTVVEHRETGECEYVFNREFVPIGRRIPELVGIAWHRHYGPEAEKPHGPLGP